MSRPAGGLTKLERLVPALEQLGGVALRVWRTDGTSTRLLAGTPVAWTPAFGAAANGTGQRDTPDGPAWYEPVRGGPGLWLEVRAGEPGAPARPDARELVAEAVGCLAEAEREAAQVAAELSDRYEEIDLVYTISEILGHTIRLDEAARRILQEVATVVGARRASLFVLDLDRHVLRLVAAKGMVTTEVDPIELDDTVSVTARAFREMRIQSNDPAEPEPAAARGQASRSYRGRAFLAVPVMYGAPGDQARPIGVINLTDRHGSDAFSAGDRKLVAAIANQVGAAIENARLVARD